MASESSPKPISTDFTSNSRSNSATIGMLPPPRAALSGCRPLHHTNVLNADNAETLDMLRNFCFYLQRQGLLHHTLLLTVDER